MAAKSYPHYLFPEMQAYLESLRLNSRAKTARTAGQALEQLGGYLQVRGIDPLCATTAELQDYLSWLTSTYRSPRDEPLARSTVATRIAYIKGWYAWLYDRSLIAAEPAKDLQVKVTRSRVVLREHLSVQELTALMETQVAAVDAAEPDSYSWQMAVRNLAIMALTIATGRRIGGVVALTVDQVDRERNEIRIEREKGRTGRVLPVKAWAMDAIGRYLDDVRPQLVSDTAVPWLFLNTDGDGPITRDALRWLLKELLKKTIAANLDLEALPKKRITWHSLRVSFATMLFYNGCDIRTVNELLLHRSLSTTARYTPVAVDNLKDVFIEKHPRR